jgi:hypothetical protein
MALRLKKIFNTLFTVLFCLCIFACTQGSTTSKLDTPAEGAVNEEPTAGTINERLAEAAGEERLIYHIGPIDLPSGTEAEVDDPLTMNAHLTKPVWVVGFEPRVVNADGEELDGQLLHSAIVSNLHEENPLCTSSNVGNPFVMSTSTLKDIRFPRGYGYPLLPTDPIEAKVVFRNLTDQGYVDVYFELALITKPMNEFVSMKDLKPMLYDVDACNHQPQAVEPNNISRKQATYTLSEPYKLIMAHGGIQNYGIQVDLTSNKDVLPFWTAETVIDGQSFVIDLRNDPFQDPSGIPFKRGDSLTLGVIYDNTSNEWLEDATAAAMIYFAPQE